jgi:hypothetical protein
MDLNEISKYAVENYGIEDGQVEEFVTQFIEVVENPLTLIEILEDFLSSFSNDQLEVDKLFGYQRWSFISLRFYFFKFFYEYPISDKDAINDILMLYKPMLEEHKNYWANKYCVLPESNETNKQFDLKFKLEQIIEGFNILTKKIKNADNHKHILSDFDKSLINDLLIMLGNVNDHFSNSQVEKVNINIYNSLVYIKEQVSDKNDIQYINKLISLFEDHSKDDGNEAENLASLICHKDSQEIVDSIKVKYRNIGGKRLKILLLSFQDLALLPKDNIASKFHRLCKKEFDWDIKSYSAMNDYKYNNQIDDDEKTAMLTFIKDIISKA